MHRSFSVPYFHWSSHVIKSGEKNVFDYSENATDNGITTIFFPDDDVDSDFFKDNSDPRSSIKPYLHSILALLQMLVKAILGYGDIPPWMESHLIGFFKTSCILGPESLHSLPAGIIPRLKSGCWHGLALAQFSNLKYAAPNLLLVSMMFGQEDWIWTNEEHLAQEFGKFPTSTPLAGGSRLRWNMCGGSNADRECYLPVMIQDSKISCFSFAWRYNLVVYVNWKWLERYNWDSFLDFEKASFGFRTRQCH